MAHVPPAAPRAGLAERVWLIALLCALGAGWGLTQPLAKIAVSGGYGQFGLIFWQMVIGAALLWPVCLARGRGMPRGRARLAICAVIAILGTVVPNSGSYVAAMHLPAGVISIVVSLAAMASWPVAMALGMDAFTWGRLAGLCLGLGGVLVLTAPSSSLPDPAMAAWIPIALIAPIFYAFEGNFVARVGLAGMDPVQALLGASVLGAAMALPLALATGQWIDPRPPWSAEDAALVALSAIHAVVYAAYVWLVGRAGAVFATQVAYLVTGFGLGWAMLLLDERYSGWVWLALALMLAGIFMVQPRPKAALVPEPAIGKDAR